MKEFRLRNYDHRGILLFAICLAALAFAAYAGSSVFLSGAENSGSLRTRLLINDDWRFIKGDPSDNTTSLSYDNVKSWILPAGNDFMLDPAKRGKRPEGNPGGDMSYVAGGYDKTRTGITAKPASIN